MLYRKNSRRTRKVEPEMLASKSAFLALIAASTVAVGCAPDPEYDAHMIDLISSGNEIFAQSVHVDENFATLFESVKDKAISCDSNFAEDVFMMVMPSHVGTSFDQDEGFGEIRSVNKGTLTTGTKIEELIYSILIKEDGANRSVVYISYRDETQLKYYKSWLTDQGTCPPKLGAA